MVFSCAPNFRAKASAKKQALKQKLAGAGAYHGVSLRLLLVDRQVDEQDVLPHAALSSVHVVKYDAHTTTLAGLVGLIREAHRQNGAPFLSMAIAQHGADEHGQWAWTTDLTVNLKNMHGAINQLAPVIEVLAAALSKTKAGKAHIDFLACNLATTCKGLVPALEKMYGIDFRASTDDTGNALSGGDWKMETDNDYDVAADYLDAVKLKQYTERMNGTHPHKYTTQQAYVASIVARYVPPSLDAILVGADPKNKESVNDRVANDVIKKHLKPCDCLRGPKTHVHATVERCKKCGGKKLSEKVLAELPALAARVGQAVFPDLGPTLTRDWLPDGSRGEYDELHTFFRNPPTHTTFMPYFIRLEQLVRVAKLYLQSPACWDAIDTDIKIEGNDRLFSNAAPYADDFKARGEAFACRKVAGTTKFDHQGHFVPQTMLNQVICSPAAALSCFINYYVMEHYGCGGQLPENKTPGCDVETELFNAFKKHATNLGRFPAWLQQAFDYLVHLHNQQPAAARPVLVFEVEDFNDPSKYAERLSNLFSVVIWNPVNICRAPEDKHRPDGAPGDKFDAQVVRSVVSLDVVALQPAWYAALQAFATSVAADGAVADDAVSAYVAACCALLPVMSIEGAHLGFHSFDWERAKENEGLFEPKGTQAIKIQALGLDAK